MGTHPAGDGRRACPACDSATCLTQKRQEMPPPTVRRARVCSRRSMPLSVLAMRPAKTPGGSFLGAALNSKMGFAGRQGVESGSFRGGFTARLGQSHRRFPCVRPFGSGRLDEGGQMRTRLIRRRTSELIKRQHLSGRRWQRGTAQTLCGDRYPPRDLCEQVPTAPSSVSSSPP